MCKGTAGQLLAGRCGWSAGCLLAGEREAGHETEWGGWHQAVNGLQGQPRISNLHTIGNREAVETCNLSLPPSSEFFTLYSGLGS